MASQKSASVQQTASSEAATSQRVETDQCARCGKPLAEQSKLAFGKLYHFDCFTCTSCDTKMMPYVVHGGKPYCLLCTHTMFEPQCAECGCWLFGRKSESKPPVFALGHLYHSRCFQCSTCGKQILGKFYISGLQKIYCPSHPPEGTTAEMKKLCDAPMPPEKSEYIYETSAVTSTELETE